MKLQVANFGQADWNSVVSWFSDLSLIQTWEYGEVTGTKPIEVSRMIFTDGDGVVGAAQALIRRVPYLDRGLVWINRAPLWRRGGGSDEPARLLEMLAVLKKYWVDEQKMYLRVAPTAIEGELLRAAITAQGYTSTDESRGWISGRLDLSRSLDDLTKGLRPNWRSSVKKGEALGVSVQLGVEDTLFNSIGAEYDRMLAEKGFHTTVTPEFLKRFQKAAEDRHKLLCLTASLNDEPLGGILVARYGRTCEYLVGAITAAGKTRNAGQLLLWKAITHTKENGYARFDLGGMDPEGTPAGVLYFKSGVGATPYRLIGDFDACIEGLLSKTIRWQLQRALH